MKNVSNMRKKELRREQFSTLIEVIELIRTRGDLELFLRSFLSESEAAYLSQRLNIMRMLAKNFKYSQIKEKLGVPAATISKAKNCLDGAGNDLTMIILSYRHKPNKKRSEDDTWKLPHYPGSIF